MAYLVVSFKGEETGRYPLTGSMVIGRAHDCDIAVRDILLSRHHCKFEKEGNRWYVTDLASKNGTLIAGETVQRQALREGDIVKLGKTTVRFYPGKLPTNQPASPTNGKRPADPFDSLSGTVVDFELIPRRKNTRPVEQFPKPQPAPPEPDSYNKEDVHSMLNELVSSSWDSIYESASQRVPGESAPGVVLPGAKRRVRPREPKVDLALQVHAEPADKTQTAAPPEPPTELIERLAIAGNPPQDKTNPDAPPLPAPPGATNPPPRRGWFSIMKRFAPLFQWFTVIALSRLL